MENRDAILSKNPNMLFFPDMRQAYAPLDRFGEDWYGWLRDEDGNPSTYAQLSGEPEMNHLAPRDRDAVYEAVVKAVGALLRKAMNCPR